VNNSRRSRIKTISAEISTLTRRALVEKAKRVLPGLCTDNASKYIGRRPLTPDTKPIIGRAANTQNVLIASGHGQLGLTLGATSALLIADLAARRQPRIDLTAFRPNRF
jgi:D-amino-acid dehydrogenase